MYVFQSPLIPLVASGWSATLIAGWLGLGGNASVLAHLIYAAGMFAITTAMALLSWNILEKHCLKLKAYFPTQGAKASPSSFPVAMVKSAC